MSTNAIQERQHQKIIFSIQFSLFPHVVAFEFYYYSCEKREDDEAVKYEIFHHFHCIFY